MNLPSSTAWSITWPIALAGAAVATVVAAGWLLRPRPVRRSSVGVPPTSRQRLRSPWPRRVRTSGPAEVARWCDDLARELRAGHTPRRALLSVHGEVGTTLGAATGRLAVVLDRGVDPAAALRRVGEERPDDDPIRSACLVAAVAADLGGSIADPLDRVAAALRARAADAAERAAHSAQARLSARVLTAVPAAFLALTFAVDHDVRTVVTTAPGVVVVAVGLAVNLFGGWWMRRIVAGGGW